MPRNLSREEVHEFLDSKPGWIMLSTIDPDGFPHSVPLGYFRLGNEILMRSMHFPRCMLRKFFGRFCKSSLDFLIRKLRSLGFKLTPQSRQLLSLEPTLPWPRTYSIRCDSRFVG